MSISFMIVLFVLGFIGSFLSGMLGVGGAIINYPLILFALPVLGFTGYSPHEVSGIVAVQVLFATLGGVIPYRKSGYLNKRLIIIMGISILVGSLLGGYSSQYLSGNVVNIIYGVLALLAVILMFIPKESKEEESDNEGLNYRHILIGSLSFLVGICSGIVGAGGSFLLVPIMLTILKLPIRVTIATSLAVTFISSLGSVSGKLLSQQILFLPSFIVVIASIIASPFGAKLGQKMSATGLKWALVVLILGTAVKEWASIIF